MKIGHCGFSFHTNGYFETKKNGFDTYLFRVQTEGTSEAMVNNQAFTMEKGDLLLVAPGQSYQLSIDANSKSSDFHLFFSGDWIDQWWRRSDKPTMVKIELEERILTLWRFLVAEKRRPLTNQNSELMESLLRSICLFIERTIEDRSAYIRPFVVTKMMRFIEENATTTFTVNDVAEHSDLSVSRTVHLFKEYVGKTIMGYAQEIRLSTAIDQMKHTTMTLEHIAFNCGFGSYPYFHRVFKKVYGVSPGRYRKTE
ncbi:AraC family transcriptional regulator of arabinose operon [Natronobacillus azotifigens]|uniref:AraC family transcriptional regulator n=1 Tax=Natronobacillus azotifigens TaxID=472978 RepID=A0A9J6RDR3_9BACI|nr:AraC family transcriptional regulator [Natronobacillus azotifigens]MCZ0703882.1 AraC family transcriptional regulator [Natronobacillus azotifigens]